MSFHLYDSAQRRVVEFQPLEPGKVSIYCCGATVQSAPHLGHVRKEVNFDVLSRWLERSGYQVTMVTNVTDIDDKILAKSAEAGRPWWAHAYLFEDAFHSAFRALGVRRPTYEPRATGHVPEMIELMATLIDAGHAYAADDGSGDVYFDVQSWPAYGELSGMKVDEMEAAQDADPRGKRDPRDFALWKGAKPGDPESASWETPWGRGRPGWHLECSAMAGKYLGDAFDIHGGGIDLRFPHHENEQAQSHGAGWGFARLWVHNAWVTTQGEKMSKSLGNTLSVAALTRDFPAVVVRWALSTVHHRSAIEWGPETLPTAAVAWERFGGFVGRSIAAVGQVPADEVRSLTPAQLPSAFSAALDDDLNVAGAMAVAHEHLRAGNTALASGDAAVVRREQLLVRSMLDVLGLDPASDQWCDMLGGGAGAEGLGWAEHQALDALVEALIAERAEARAAKDWARADALRDRLTAAGVALEDGRDGATWRVG